MFFHLQYIHLFRPFLKYTPAASPLPSHVSPRRICTANAIAISKLIRLYKKCYNLRQICNIAVYMVHSACTIHLLNLPEKTARRDITHGVRHLEEIAEDWLCARRTLGILSVLSRKWGCALPDEAAAVLQRTDERYGTFSTAEVPSPSSGGSSLPADSPPADLGSAALSKADSYHARMSYDPLQNSEAMMRQAASSALGATSMPLPQPPIPMPTQGMPPADWSAPMRTTPALPNYRPAPPFARAPASSSQTSRSTTRNVSPSLLGEPSIDGQNWYLHDGVRWHQNFESWGLPPVSSAPGNAGASRAAEGAALQAASPSFSDFGFRRMDELGYDPLTMGSEWLSGLD